jgi:quercetin dioxygenase-like cupin family protein
MPDIMPKGAGMQVLHGDPASGAADFYFKVPPNYTFPWHFHTPVEKLFVDEGMLRWELRGGETKTLDAGDYVYVPARSPHRVTCTSTQPCYFFLASNGSVRHAPGGREDVDHDEELARRRYRHRREPLSGCVQSAVSTRGV